MVGRKADAGAVFFVRGFERTVFDEFAARETGAFLLAVTYGFDTECRGERVDGFGTDAVEPDGFLEDFGVVFGAGIHLRNALHDLAERDAAAVVADGDAAVVFYLDVDALAVAHDEFVYRIVDDFFQQYINPVVLVLTSKPNQLYFA